VSCSLADQRFHDRNLYVGNPDQESTKFSIRILTSYALRRRFPRMRRFANYSFAEALSWRGDQREIREEVGRTITDYLAETPGLESLEVRGLILLHRARRWLKRRRARVGAG
jgi:hypothetical protein